MWSVHSTPDLMASYSQNGVTFKWHLTALPVSYSRRMSFGKEIALFFFTKGPDIPFGGKIKNHFSCSCETITNRLRTSPNQSFWIICANGYSNLKSHLLLCISNYQTIYDNRENVVANMLNFVKVDKKTNNIVKWCELVVLENLCFSYVENDIVWK